MVEKFGKKGFVVVGVTSEPRSPTEKYLEDTGFKAVVAFTDGKLMETYGFKGYPSAALVGPDGKVLWTGHPAGLKESDIEDNLKGVRIRSRGSQWELSIELPKRWSAIEKKLTSGKIGYAIKDLEKAVERCDDAEEKQALEAALTQAKDLGTNEMKVAEEALAEGRFYDAIASWKEVRKHLSGQPLADEAKDKAAALEKDADKKKEVDAGERIYKAKVYAEAGKLPQAIRTLESVVKGSLEETKEAERARKLLEEYSKQQGDD